MTLYEGDIRIFARDLCFGKREPLADSHYSVVFTMTMVFENVDAFPSVEVLGVSLLIWGRELFPDCQLHRPSDQLLLCKQKKSADLQFLLKTKPLAAEHLKMLEGDPVGIFRQEGMGVVVTLRDGQGEPEWIFCQLD